MRHKSKLFGNLRLRMSFFPLNKDILKFPSHWRNQQGTWLLLFTLFVYFEGQGVQGKRRTGGREVGGTFRTWPQGQTVIGVSSNQSVLDSSHLWCSSSCPRSARATRTPLTPLLSEVSCWYLISASQTWLLQSWGGEDWLNYVANPLVL